ncbi:MAG: hypothetical protein PHR35_18680, partial [Kiritimatiellae bacterium]|nr:hypothetical protein [Kiritimatiellia bacterium]
MTKTTLATVAILAAAGGWIGAQAGGTDEFNGANYVKDWQSAKTALMRTTLDSRGAVRVGTGQAVVPWGIEGQERANYWKDVQATVTTQGVGGSCFRIEGTNVLGSPVTQAVTVTDDAVRCLYRADRPFVLRGQFPGEPEANWFKSESAAGQEVQGELWGEYADLTLHRVLEYTYGGRRLRLAFGAECPLRLTPCETVYEPARFSLASHPTGTVHEIVFDFLSLDSRAAPPARADTPLVTKPMDRNKLITGPIQAHLKSGFHPEAVVDERVTEPAAVLFTPRKGHPAVFRRKETLAFDVRLLPGASTNPIAVPLEVRCIATLNGKRVENRVVGELDKPAFSLTLKPVEPGPYRLELWAGDRKVGEDEFVVVGPIAQRRIGPFEKNPLKLREVDRIECADDRGRHEFYAICPANVATNQEKGVGRFLTLKQSITNAMESTYGQPLDWLAYRVNGLATDRPHLLTVEYPDIADMLVSVETKHPFLPAGLPRDTQGRRTITPE